VRSRLFLLALAAVAIIGCAGPGEQKVLVAAVDRTVNPASVSAVAGPATRTYPAVTARAQATAASAEASAVRAEAVAAANAAAAADAAAARAAADAAKAAASTIGSATDVTRLITLYPALDAQAAAAEQHAAAAEAHVPARRRTGTGTAEYCPTGTPPPGWRIECRPRGNWLGSQNGMPGVGEVDGWADPNTRTIVIALDPGDSVARADAAIAHELDHARCWQRGGQPTHAAGSGGQTAHCTI
jgi:hypothetical protein